MIGEAMVERAVPILPGDDLRVAKDFYVDKLGFQVQFEATEDGKEGIMGLERGTIQILRAAGAKGWRATRGGSDAAGLGD